MERFYAKKRILANRNEWCRILKSAPVDVETEDCINYFSKDSIRDAWLEMETHFCAETVMAMLAEIDRIYGDGISYEVVVEEINRVVVRYFIKGTDIYEDYVDYVFCGDSLKPVLVYEKD